MIIRWLLAEVRQKSLSDPDMRVVKKFLLWSNQQTGRGALIFSGSKMPSLVLGGA